MLNHIRLDLNSKVPKYVQLINSIIYNISIGNAKRGDKIPSINALSQEHYLSRDTVERAFSVLKKRNVIVSVPGRGTFIAESEIKIKLKVLFFVNKLSPYKMMLYNSFMEKMGDNCEVDIHSYHCDENLFLELMERYKTVYDYYVVVPHFRAENLSHISFTDKVCKAINEIPKENLLLLDSSNHSISGDYIEVYQDFENDIFSALESGQEKLKAYDKLTMVYPRATFYPYPRKILDGFRKYCSLNNFEFEIVEEITEDFELEDKSIYITIEDDDLVRVVNKVRVSEFELGVNVGVISYNDTPLKQVLGITVVSCDFNRMGQQAAEMILENKKEKVKAPFRLIERESL